MKKVYKYGTGDEVPKDAVYLNTQVEIKKTKHGTENRFVWHYFLVEVKDVK